MVQYVLHIVEGPARGEKVELPETGSFKLGRRPSCDLSLGDDEKISGQHCELVLEAGSVLLRDLESTNGTRVDGKRIQELPIEPGDRFQVGQTTIELVDPSRGEVGGGDDLQIRIDDELLRRSSKRSPVALIALVLLLAGGGAAWWFLLREDAPQKRSGKKVAAIVEVPGNLISAAKAHFEKAQSEWLPLARGGAFTRSGGAKTGKFAMRAELGGGDNENPGASFAVAMLPELVDVRAGKGYEVRAHVRSEGQVRVDVRLCFFGPAPKKDAASGDDVGEEVEDTPRRFERRPSLVVGAGLRAQADGYQELSHASAPPPASAQVGVAIVAVLPKGSREGARVWVDDVSLVATESGPLDQSRQIQGRMFFVGDPSTSGVRVQDGQKTALRSISAAPGDDDPALAALAEVMPLPWTDVGGKVAVKVEDHSVALTGFGSGRLILDVPGDAVASGYQLLRKNGNEEAFERRGGAAKIPSGVRAVYWEAELGPLLLTIDRDGASDGVGLEILPGLSDGLRFVFDAPSSLRLQLAFEQETLTTLRLWREAEAARERGAADEALAKLTEILRRSPFHAATVTKAELARGRILQEARQRLSSVAADFDQAQIFEYEGLFRSLLARLDELEPMRRDFGDALTKLRGSVEARLAEVVKARGERRGKNLLALAAALEEAKQAKLAGLVRDFVQRRGLDTGK